MRLSCAGCNGGELGSWSTYMPALLGSVRKLVKADAKPVALFTPCINSGAAKARSSTQSFGRQRQIARTQLDFLVRLDAIGIPQ